MIFSYWIGFSEMMKCHSFTIWTVLMTYTLYSILVHHQVKNLRISWRLFPLFPFCSFDFSVSILFDKIRFPVKLCTLMREIGKNCDYFLEYCYFLNYIFFCLWSVSSSHKTLLWLLINKKWLGMILKRYLTVVF